MEKHLVYLVLILLVSCVDTNLRQTSRSLEDAKEKGVFKQQYRPLSNPIVDNDSIRVEVESAWVESVWYYDDIWGRTIRPSGEECLRIKLKDTLSVYYGIRWEIAKKYEENIRPAGRFDMIATLIGYTDNDTIVYYLRDGYTTIEDTAYYKSKKIVFVPTSTR